MVLNYVSFGQKNQKSQDALDKSFLINSEVCSGITKKSSQKEFLLKLIKIMSFMLKGLVS